MPTRHDAPGSTPARQHSWARSHRVVAVGGTIIALLAFGVLAGCAAKDPDSHTAAPNNSGTGQRPPVVVYRTPTCSCCKSYEEYLRKHGYAIRSEVLDDLEPVRAEHHVPSAAASCHTVLIDGYAVEGHVPVEAIDKLLTERPAVDGIAIPGMPTNAPGMGEPDGKPIEVVSFSNNSVTPFTTL